MEKEILSKRLSVGLEVYRATVLEGKTIHFNDLVERLEKKGLASRSTVSKSLDALFDLGLLRSDMQLIDGRWMKCINLAGEANAFFEHIYKDLKKQKLID